MSSTKEESLWDKIRPKKGFVKEADTANYTDEETDALFADLVNDSIKEQKKLIP